MTKRHIFCDRQLPLTHCERLRRCRAASSFFQVPREPAEAGRARSAFTVHVGLHLQSFAVGLLQLAMKRLHLKDLSLSKARGQKTN